MRACKQRGILRSYFHKAQAQLWDEIILAEECGRPFDEVSLIDRLSTTKNGISEELCQQLMKCAQEAGDPDKIDGYCETLIDTKNRRDAITLADALAKRARAGSPQWRGELLKILEIGNAILPEELPPMISAFDLCANPPPTPPELIEGILHQGSKMALGGGSKSFKTWALLEMAVAVASGREWMGFSTTESPVLYVNLELPAFSIEQRIRAICGALNAPKPKNFIVWNLRGFSAPAEIILPNITKAIQKKGFALTILDPLYKLLGSRDENSTRDMADLMNNVERLTINAGPAVVFGSHFAKGNASGKESMDRISGSGVFARDPDSIVTMTAHEQPNCFSVEMTLRNFPPQEKFVIRRQHPLMIVDGQLDPAKLKPRVGRKQQVSADDVLAELANDSLAYNQWRDRVIKNLFVSEDTFKRRLRELRKDNLCQEADGKYTKT